jgi:hypothetical protein
LPGRLVEFGGLTSLAAGASTLDSRRTERARADGTREATNGDVAVAGSESRAGTGDLWCRVTSWVLRRWVGGLDVEVSGL